MSVVQRDQREDVDYILSRVRQRGWSVDRIGSVRNFVGTPVTPASAANR